MKNLSIRLESGIFTWLNQISNRTGYSISELIRSFIKSASSNQSVLEDFSPMQLTYTPMSEFEKSLISRFIITEKLLEYLVVTGANEAHLVLEKANSKAQEIGNNLGLNNAPNKRYKVSLYLNADAMNWLKEKALSMKLTASQLVRNIVRNHYGLALKQGQHSELSFTQIQSIKYAILTNQLLIEFVTKSFENGEQIKSIAYENAKPFIEKMLHHFEAL